LRWSFSRDNQAVGHRRHPRRDGRQQILRLGLRGRWRQRFAALLARIAALAVSTVAQFAADQKNPVPRPWKPPPPRFQPPLLPALK